MDYISINREVLIKKLRNLNVFKSPGPDILHPRIIKEVRALPLKVIFDTPLGSYH